MWKWIVVFLAVAGAVGGIALATRSTRTSPVPPLAQDPVRNPYHLAVAGAGIVEPASENIVIGVPEAGLVTKLWVARGQVVKAWDPLFQVDPRSLDAERLSGEADVRIAEAALVGVRAYRRPEEEPSLVAHLGEAQAAVDQAGQEKVQAEAAVTGAEADLKDLRAFQERREATTSVGATTVEELDRSRRAAEMATARLAVARGGVGAAAARQRVSEARVAGARAELDLFRAGPWQPDVARAEAALGAARARLDRLRLDIERRTVRAPIDGTVLRCYLHEGEYAGAGASQADQAALVIGDLARLRVRVDVDEFDAARFRPAAAATAFFKGRAAPAIGLSFVATEPFVAPKRSLTNSQRELVDTRVLQVIYALADPHPAVYPGQQLDVFIEASE
jgi:multidrug resistance efflux pump